MASSKALRACNSPNSACRAGPSGAGSTCPPSNFKEQAVATIGLPTKDRKLEAYTTGEPIVFPSKAETRSFNRIAYAAAHVVADPLADIDPWVDVAVDWEKTIAF